MEIKKHAICDSKGKVICRISYNSEEEIWLVYFMSEGTLTTLTLFVNGTFGQLDIPEESRKIEPLEEGVVYGDVLVLDPKFDLESRKDMGDEDSDDYSFCDILNLSEQRVCKIGFNKEDGTWSLEFQDKNFRIMLFLYWIGSFTQVKLLAD